MPRGIYEWTPEHNAALSKELTGRTLTPEHRAAMSKAQRGVPKSQEHCAALSKALIGRTLSPETCDAMSVAHTGVPLSPEHYAAMSTATEAFRDGNDICNHHYLYDHSDLSLNIVQITRSDHQKLHRLLQKLGYIIPHINR